MKNGMTRTLGLLAVAAGLVLWTGCNDSQGPAAHPWAGSYTAHVKWGGASGTWSAFGSLEVTSATVVRLNGVQIVNPTWQADTLSWTTTDGNAGNGDIAFKTASANAYYWDAPVQGKLFEGAYQNPGEGWVDFRGIVD